MSGHIIAVVMLKLVVLSALVVAGSYAFPGRIVNGTSASLGEIPYIVSLQHYGSHFCGGSILDATHILTAAHCIYGGNTHGFKIQYGIIDIQSNENKIDVIRQIYHEEYAPGNGYFNDVAVLTLATPIKFSEYAQPTVLPEQDEVTPEFSASVLAGWGYEQTGGFIQRFLQRVDLRIFSDEECETRHSGDTNRVVHVCSGVDNGGKGQCSGDSGGPLYANGKQVGIVSWSIKPCTVAPYPGVFAKVSTYVNWIKKQMQN